MYSPTGVNVNDLPLPMESFTQQELLLLVDEPSYFLRMKLYLRPYMFLEGPSKGNNQVAMGYPS